MREIRLLHFHSYIDADEGLWCLGESSSKGIPLYAALDRVSTQAFFSHSQKPALGLLDALADAVGEGGPMNGWYISPSIRFMARG